MDTFKKILRDTLAAGAQRIQLIAGSGINVTTAQGLLPLSGAPPIDEAYLAKLFQVLFPTEQVGLANKSLSKGALSIPNVGKLLLIAQAHPPASLHIYVPPTGPSLFDADWQTLSAASSAAPAAAPMATNAIAPLGAVDLFGSIVKPAARTPEPTAKLPDTAAAGPVGFVPPLQPPPIPHSAVASSPTGSFVPPLQPPPIPQPARDSTPTAAAADTRVMIDFNADSGAGDVSDGRNAIDPVLADMIKRKASDLHMTSGEPYCLRIDGEITRVGTQTLTPEAMAAYLLPIMPPRNQQEFIKINDTDFAYEIRGIGRFRVNVFRDRTGVGTVMRHIPSKILTAEQLSLPPAITKFCSLSKGLVVVTGPTGSGKSTTLAAMIDLINKTRHDHILTIEDPIEFVHPQQRCLVNQREVHKHTGSFSRALKAALREDPDIVLIGEMRDLETVAIAIETAETGHLVFGTLHTNTAVSTIDRIIDQFSSDQQSQIRQMLASSLKGVVAQTLLKKKGGGRVAAHEILVVNDAVSAMIREGKNHMIANHMQSQKQDGNILLTETLARLVKDELIEAEDAFRKAVDKASLLDAFKRQGIKVNESLAPAAPVKKPA